MVIAAGDSHTTTYGALGAFGFGIGTSEIEHYLATQTLVYKRLKTMRVTVTGRLGIAVTAKDIIMALIQKIGASGATGFAIEFAGPAIDELSVEGRMTICNMAVEAGARGAFMARMKKFINICRTNRARQKASYGSRRCSHGASYVPTPVPYSILKSPWTAICWNLW
ncbi:3-isopropylmalate dehydratase large subunit [Budvicia aquatica]|uniref:3-isopropylmalate dehydratase n=1 Tax=Budvicia aquatica TaxID=82979 RepID=A0A484ZEI1_9GAMM|nr:3-isopropylmalate dehydratase large subunit [Budvicia aquatica]